jgi:hypothetical protein
MLLAVVGILAVTACAIPGQATSKPTVTPTCSISMQWPGAGDTSDQGTPAASDQTVVSFSQKISAGPNAQTMQCNVVETQAKGSLFLSEITAALHMTPKQLASLDVYVWNQNANNKRGREYPNPSRITAGGEIITSPTFINFYRGLFVDASSVTITSDINGKNETRTIVVVATLFAGKDNGPFIVLSGFDEGDSITLAIPLVHSPYPRDAVTTPSGEIQTVDLSVSLSDFLNSLGTRQFDPNHLAIPAINYSGVRNIMLKRGTVINAVYNSSEATRKLLETVADGNSDAPTAYSAILQQYGAETPNILVSSMEPDQIATAFYNVGQGTKTEDPSPFVKLIALPSMSQAYFLSVQDTLFPNHTFTTTISLNGHEMQAARA